MEGTLRPRNSGKDKNFLKAAQTYPRDTAPGQWPLQGLA